MKGMGPFCFLVASLVCSTALAQAPDTDLAAPTRAVGGVKLSQEFVVDAPPDDEGTVIATVGTPLLLTLTVQHPRRATVAVPDNAETGRFELVKTDRSDPRPIDEDTVEQTLTLHFAVYRPGRHTLSPLEIQILDADGNIQTLPTEPVEVRVESVAATEEELVMPAPRPPVPVYQEDWTLVAVVSSVLGLLLAGLLGAFVYKRFNPAPAPPPPPPRPAYDVAMEKLGAIKAAQLVEEGLLEAYYVRLSETVREYLGRRYAVSLTDKQGLELTTEELMAALADVHWPRGLMRDDVETFLYDCDIVKFARYSPSEDEANELLDQAFRIVQLTRPSDLGASVVHHGASSGTSPDATSPDATSPPTGPLTDVARTTSSTPDPTVPIPSEGPTTEDEEDRDDV